jgi:hypothetical protein
MNPPKRIALLLVLIAIAAAMSAAWFFQMQSDARKRAGSISTQPAAMGEFESLERFQLQTDAEALDGFGRNATLRFQSMWRTRSYPISNEEMQRLPMALIAQVEPGTKRNLQTVRVDNQVWLGIANRLGVKVDAQTSTAFAGTLARPDEKPRAVFVDLRAVKTDPPAPMRLEYRVTVCTPPEPGIDFSLSRAGDWLPLADFDRDLFASRAARVQFNGTPLTDHAALLLLDKDGTPTHYRITIDNADGANVERAE